ncbi:hypothetical protein [Halomonas piscis]|uniref:hypothetical protein n=1 Tax=Halomonas piscis TaxID=3031727 RepID=UPI0028997D10|nr:hypothetical protein [Halomonas piscis]
MSNSQSWLKSMENGGLGEARAKAFLLERFWVLERSVDIQGADYLIQRKITSKNFMDKEPPKLGVVQVKYIQDGNTYISISKDYVVNDSREAYGEFFLLIFSGQEDEARSFLMTSKDVLDRFEESESKGRIRLRVRGEEILDNRNFEILNKAEALNKIEHALKKSDFKRNRMFLGATNYIKLSSDQIEHDFLLPLDNGYADLKEEFFKNKKRLQSTLFDIEEVVEGMKDILKTSDPEEAFRVYEDVIGHYIGASMGTYISFGVEFFDDEDFLEAVKNHKERLSAIRNLGLESSYFALLDSFVKSVSMQTSKLELSKEERVEVTVKYDSRTLENPSVIVSKASYEGECPSVEASVLGCQRLYFHPWSWFSWEIRAGEEAVPVKPSDIEQQYINSSWKFRRPFQVSIEKLLIGEDLIAPWMVQT